MTTQAPGTDLEARRRAVRRRALANLVLVLREEAGRTAGRLAVRPFARDAVLLAFQDVRTLVRSGGVFALEPRDFSVVLYCPPAWPLDRGAPLVPVVISPPDFHHPNSDGHRLCIDVQGVLPERVPGLLYDNLRLHHRRLDHCVDFAAADFVRARPEEFPADRRPLVPGSGEESA